MSYMIQVFDFIAPVPTSAEVPFGGNTGVSFAQATESKIYLDDADNRFQPATFYVEQDHKLLIEHDRALRAQIGAALDLLEAETGTSITTTVPSAVLEQWRETLAQLRPDGQTQQSWLWEAPAKHSTVQITQVFERICLLYSLDVHKQLGTWSDRIVRR